MDNPVFFIKAVYIPSQYTVNSNLAHYMNLQEHFPPLNNICARHFKPILSNSFEHLFSVQIAKLDYWIKYKANRNGLFSSSINN